MKVVYSRRALTDLEDIDAYFSEKVNPEFASEMLERITGTFEGLIQRNPKAGRRREDLGPDMRAFVVLPYLVFYRASRGRINVTRVLHGRRDIRPPLASLLSAI